MEAIEIVRGLMGFPGRGAGTDAERRAALWLAAQLSTAAQDVHVETFWCRPNWAFAHAIHAALAIAGSLVSLASPIAGLVLLALALASVLADWLTGHSLGRALTREHASQNVLLGPPSREAPEPSTRLILTANYDAGRTGLVYRDWLRRPTATIRRVLGRAAPGWIGWLAIGIVWLIALAALRLAGHSSHSVRVLQLVPTAMLIAGFGLLFDLALASWSPAAGDNGTGVAVAVALAQALGTTPLEHLEVELVLSGAGDGDQVGLRHHLRRSRRDRVASNTVVLGFGACSAGTVRWWISDGQLIPLRYGRPLRDLATALAADEPHLGAGPVRARGATPALAARMIGIPALTLGCLDDDGLVPHSHQPADRLEAIDSSALDDALQFALLVVDEIDAVVGELQELRATAPA